MPSLLARLAKLETRFVAVRSRQEGPDLTKYRDDPEGYIRDVLGLTLTPGQVEVVRALMEQPRRVLVSSGHSVGKSTLGAALVNWWFDCRRGICLTTAPTDRQVKGILWKEVRVQRARAGLPDFWAGPKIPRLESTPDHFAHGFTARDATHFQGQHSAGGVLIVFDEAEGIDGDFWAALKTMLDDDSYFVGFYNPTSPGSAAHQAEAQADEHGLYRRVHLSCVDHPNVLADVAGLPVPIPGAIRLQQLRTMLLEDSLVLGPDDAPEPGDVVLAGVRYRPGPIAEARCLGRRPAQGVAGLWGEALWARVLATRVKIHPKWGIAVGCDVARYGDDSTSIFVRKGTALLRCEQHRKLSTKQVAERLKQVCEEVKDLYNDPQRIPCLVDEGGIGGGVIDQRGAYLFIPVNAGRKPRNPARYKLLRDELWFTAREPALAGTLDVSRLPPGMLARLKQELMVCQYQIIPGTDKVRVTSKDDMKAKSGRSPDLADGFCLALYPPTQHQL